MYILQMPTFKFNTGHIHNCRIEVVMFESYCMFLLFSAMKSTLPVSFCFQVSFENVCNIRHISHFIIYTCFVNLWYLSLFSWIYFLPSSLRPGLLSAVSCWILVRTVMNERCQYFLLPVWPSKMEDGYSKFKNSGKNFGTMSAFVHNR